MEEVLNEIKLHTHTIVKLEDKLGSDQSIERAARVSYGAETRAVTDTRTLLRYLMNHNHTSPFEMAEVVLYLKIPIFVMRQLVRHRTANINEYSARYSVMKDEFYIPEASYIQPQSKTNKQGRDGELDDCTKWAANEVIKKSIVESKENYDKLLELGVSRELSRIVMPVASYTELYWKCDLHNLMHMLKLRCDPHAQIEIRDIANAIYQLVKPLFPLTFEAFEDYRLNAVKFSALEMKALKFMINNIFVNNITPGDLEFEDWGTICDTAGMTKRETEEFKSKLL